MMTKEFILLPVVLNLFDGTEPHQNATTSDGLTEEMKIFYNKTLIELTEPELVHDQFAQKYPIPQNGGKTIEFRKYDSLGVATTPLTEGITPKGQKLSMKTKRATVEQYGGFTELPDMLLLAAIDNNIVQATKVMASQAGRTLDTITRDVLAGGTVVRYANSKTSRTALTESDKLTVDDVRKAVRDLKIMNAPKIDGYYVGIIHPDCAYDLMSDEKWVNVKTYSDPEGIYEGEIGRIEGVRFVETTESKIFEKAGANERDVYSTLIIGDGAYGVTEIVGGGLKHIVKQLGSAGTADPLDQRATAGWKATKAAVRLVEQYMVRIESGSTFTGSLSESEAVLDEEWKSAQ